MQCCKFICQGLCGRMWWAKNGVDKTHGSSPPPHGSSPPKCMFSISQGSGRAIWVCQLATLHTIIRTWVFQLWHDNHGLAWFIEHINIIKYPKPEVFHLSGAPIRLISPLVRSTLKTREALQADLMYVSPHQLPKLQSSPRNHWGIRRKRWAIYGPIGGHHSCAVFIGHPS